MSDFLISLAKEHAGRSLLARLRQPYGTRAPDGEFFELPYGAMAVLRERLAGDRNVIAHGDTVCAWVGDLLVGDGVPRPEDLVAHVDRLSRRDETQDASADELLARLNGTFAVVSAGSDGVSIITDLLNAVPVYFAVDSAGKIVAAGTHPDVVASISNPTASIDLASAAEFINRGTPLFPYTIHTNVKEFEPGSLHRLTIEPPHGAALRSCRYWRPPPERRNGCDNRQLADELTTALRNAVTRRCNGKRVAVKLSGGLDSRVILAGVPPSMDCVTVTFCDELNREAKTARRVARIYRRPWYPLFREKEYIANNLIRTVRLTGCEHDWVHAHGAGLLDGILRHDVTCVLDGQWSNTFLRLYFAGDIRRTNRLGGLLPARYEKVDFDYTQDICRFCTEHLDTRVVEQMRSRRQDFYDRHVEPGRGSVAEWLDNYPLTQLAPLSSWLAERRLLPLRLVYLDRQLVEFGYRCPLELKGGDGVFVRAALPILGSGRRIPNANDGVRPGSGHVARLAQRAVFKLRDRLAGAAELLGRPRKVQHSWHDYQGYWQNSDTLARLAEEYGPNLDPLDGTLFHGKGRDLLRRKDMDWHYGFRLLQLAVWLGIFREYHDGR